MKYTLLLTGFSFLKTSRLAAFYSKSQRLFINKVKFIWSGGVTSNTIHVHAKLTTASTSARLLVSTDPGLSNPVYGNFGVADAGNNYIARLSVNSLAPNTTYFYAIEADGVIDTAADAIGSFKTINNGPHSFRFTIASCNRDGNHPVFYRIKDKNPSFHITHGDFHYADPNSATDINVHRAPFETTLAQPAVRSLIQNHPIAYMWDDHDYCGDNTNSFAVGRTNARLVYQEYVPHYPLPAGSGNVPIYQSFIVGRIRFILTDLRSERDVPGTTMMGAIQKAWFKNECLSAKNNDEGIIWINTVPWGNTPDNDIWYGFSTERTELSDFFKANAIRNLFIICGDAHMVAIDNGTNHDFSTGGANPFKYTVLQAAAVNQTGSFRGGPFSEGYFQNPSFEYGQYVAVDIADTGGSDMQITLTGYRVNNAGVESTLINYTFNFSFLSVLPIKISGFSASKSGDGSKAILSFTLDQVNASCRKILIERSSDGLTYQQIEHLACNGLFTRIEHKVTDQSPLEGSNFYRLKIVEDNGTAIFSEMKKLVFHEENKITILRNPARDNLTFQVNTKKAGLAAYTIQDSSGRTFSNGKLQLVKGSNKYTINISGASKGIYFLLIDTNGNMTKERFVVA